MIFVPLQTIKEPSAVRRRTPSEESDVGPGSTETEAPDWPRTPRRREYLVGTEERNYTALAQKQDQEQEQVQNSTRRNQQVGREARLLVFRLRTGFLIVLSFVPCFLWYQQGSGEEEEREDKAGVGETLIGRSRTGSGNNSVNWTSSSWPARRFTSEEILL